MNEAEGRLLAAIPKWGEPREQWAQDRPNTLTNGFGVVDALGRTIPGMHAELEVFISPSLGQVKYVFSLKRFELGRIERIYQLEINPRAGLRRSDHAFSHEHYGETSFKADDDWAWADFDDAVRRFCANANVEFTAEMPNYQGFILK